MLTILSLLLVLFCAWPVCAFVPSMFLHVDAWNMLLALCSIVWLGVSTFSSIMYWCNSLCLTTSWCIYPVTSCTNPFSPSCFADLYLRSQFRVLFPFSNRTPASDGELGPDVSSSVPSRDDWAIPPFLVWESIHDCGAYLDILSFEAVGMKRDKASVMMFPCTQMQYLDGRLE